MSDNPSLIPVAPLLPSGPLPTVSKSQDKKKKLTDKYIGLRNQGSTCYLNSLIQSLFMTPEFRANILKWTYDINFHGLPEDCIPFQLQKLFSRLQVPIRDAEETVGLTRSFQWSSNEVYVQQDIQELCRVLFEAIQISLGEQEANFINDLYSGESHSVVKCLECNTCSINKDFFLDLTLPILNIFENIHNKSLDMALMNFIKPEKLEEDNKYQCEKCNKKVNALKYLKFEKLPQLLFIQLGRFYYDYQTDMRQKIHDKVPFPLILNMNKYKKDYDTITYNVDESENEKFCLDDSEEVIAKYKKEGENVYELYSVVVQSGSANGGHYYAYIKSFEDGKWYNFNDANVYEIEKKDIAEVFGQINNSGRYQSSATAYCLMYRKLGMKKLTIDDMKINQVLTGMIQEENEKIIKEEKEKKERLNRINIKIFYNDNQKEITTLRTNTINEFKEQICKAFDIDISKKDTFLIREYDMLNKKKLDYIDTEDVSLEKAYITAYKIYTLQFQDENGKFPIYDQTLIDVFLYLYDDYKDVKDKREKERLNKQKKITISNQKTMNELASLICDTIHFDISKKDQLLVLKKAEISLNSKLYEISYDELYSDKQIFLCSILDRCELYIEQRTENSKWKELFVNINSKIDVDFMVNTKERKGAILITFSKSEELSKVKEKVCKDFKVDIDHVIMKTKKGKEITNLNDELFSILESNESTNTLIHIVEGTPLKSNEMYFTVLMCVTDTKKFNFFPFVFNEVLKIKLNTNDTIAAIKKELIQKIDLITDKEISLDKVLIRLYSSEKPTKILYDTSPMQRYVNEFGGSEPKIVIQIQNVDQSLIDKNIFSDIIEEDNLIQISICNLNLSNWTVTTPIDLLINANEAITSLSQAILSHFPLLDSIDNIEAVKVSNGYNLYMDTITKFNFVNLAEISFSKINEYPFFIKNDGFMLLLKDKRVKEGTITEEIRNYSFKPDESSSIPPVPVIVEGGGSGSRVKDMINKFEKGDYDIVTHAKRNERPKIKEKGVVIKVKKFDEEEPKKEEIKSDMICNVKDNGSDILFELPPDDYPDNSNDIEPLI